MMRILICVGVLALLYEASAFKDAQDGARILPGSVLVDSSYSIPVGRRGDDKLDEQNSARFDDDDYTLISKMRKMETPPLPESVDYYASSRTASKRFRQRRSTLKFDGDSASSKPQQSSAASSSSSSPQSGSGSGDDDEKKRLFPGLFGIGGAPYYPQHHHGYPLGGQYPMYGQGYYGGGYPGGGYHHGVGGYPGGGYPGGGYPIGGGYPVGGGGYPYPGNGLGSSSASASSASSSGGGFGGLHGYPGGGYGNGLYGGGYYPPQGVAPILGAGLGGPGFGVIGGFRDKDGKGEVVAVSGTTSSNAPGAKGAGSVSFEKK